MFDFVYSVEHAMLDDISRQVYQIDSSWNELTDSYYINKKKNIDSTINH